MKRFIEVSLRPWRAQLCRTQSLRKANSSWSPFPRLLFANKMDLYSAERRLEKEKRSRLSKQHVTRQLSTIEKAFLYSKVESRPLSTLVDTRKAVEHNHSIVYKKMNQCYLLLRVLLPVA